MTSGALQWATFAAASIAAVGSVIRVAQNHYYHNRSYRLMKKAYKKRKGKK